MHRFIYSLRHLLIAGIVVTIGGLLPLSPATADTGILLSHEGASLPPEVMQDAELMSLWQKYNYLLNFYPIEEIQKMIAREESEKANLLGIQIQVSDPVEQFQPAQIHPMGIRLCPIAQQPRSIPLIRSKSVIMLSPAQSDIAPNGSTRVIQDLKNLPGLMNLYDSMRTFLYLNVRFCSRQPHRCSSQAKE